MDLTCGQDVYFWVSLCAQTQIPLLTGLDGMEYTKVSGPQAESRTVKGLQTNS